MSENWDLRYRPRKFSEVLGNKGVIQLLLKRSVDRTLSHQSMLLGGPKGCGKTTLARIIVRSIVCNSPVGGEPCFECDLCQNVLDGKFGQSTFEIDAASNGSVEKVRQIVEETNYETVNGVPPIYIIDESQRLTASAQDAFLKSVEERLLILILCTTEPHKMKGPLRSRLEEYPVSVPSQDEIVGLLSRICETEGVSFDKDALELISKVNRNCPRTSILSLEKAHVLGPISISSVRELFRFNSYELVDKILSTIDVSPKKGFSLMDELSNLESPTWIRDTIVEAIINGARIDIGAKSNYPVPLRFYQERLSGWISVAKDLGKIEKPNASDIIAVLLNPKNSPINPGNIPRPFEAHTLSASVEEVRTQVPVSSTKTNGEPTEVKKEPILSISRPKITKSESLDSGQPPVEIDGVRYSSDEVLTTLDERVKNLSKELPSMEDNSLPVELGKGHAPISEKEFVRGILSRLRPSSSTD